MNQDERAIEFLHSPPSEWRERYDKIEETDYGYLYDIIDYLDRLAVHSARLAAYVSERRNGNDHDGAVEEQNKYTKRVRKAMGYTYPQHDLHF